MLLGKRHRPHVKRTTSITEFTVDLGYLEEAAALIPSDQMSPSPRPPRRNSADFVETAHFLRVCGLCNRRLVPGRDIFMYRGDAAFCSLECRQQQIIQDERKEKFCLVSSIPKRESTSTSTAVGSETSAEGGTTVAAA